MKPLYQTRRGHIPEGSNIIVGVYLEIKYLILT
jgi:hypothetical protein